MEHPPIVIICGPIGSGKGTIIHALHHELGLQWVPTHTTRPHRQDDSILSQRVYDTETNFLRAQARGEFIETVHLDSGYYYGLLRSDLEHELNHNRPVVIEMTIDGAAKVAKIYPHTLILFVQASEKYRRDWVRQRNMPAKEIEARMKDAKREEKLASKEANFIVENMVGHPEEAIEAIKKIIVEHFPELAKE